MAEPVPVSPMVSLSAARPLLAATAHNITPAAREAPKREISLALIFDAFRLAAQIFGVCDADPILSILAASEMRTNREIVGAGLKPAPASPKTMTRFCVQTMDAGRWAWMLACIL